VTRISYISYLAAASPRHSDCWCMGNTASAQLDGASAAPRVEPTPRAPAKAASGVRDWSATMPIASIIATPARGDGARAATSSYLSASLAGGAGGWAPRPTLTTSSDAVLSISDRDAESQPPASSTLLATSSSSAAVVASRSSGVRRRSYTVRRSLLEHYGMSFFEQVRSIAILLRHSLPYDTRCYTETAGTRINRYLEQLIR